MDFVKTGRKPCRFIFVFSSPFSSSFSSFSSPPSQELSPPLVDDFLYLCDDAYTHDELLRMEREILHTLNYDINVPVAYRFVRRLARVRMKFLSKRPTRENNPTPLDCITCLKPHFSTSKGHSKSVILDYCLVGQTPPPHENLLTALSHLICLSTFP